MTTDYDPLLVPPPPEVPLKDAPLVRVIAQVRFPTIASIEKRDFIAAFQEAIRGHYPVLRAERAQALVLHPEGVAPAQTETVWRFSDVDRRWRVSLAAEFLALETTAYQSRLDFIQRLGLVVDALGQHLGPQVVDRLGVRYIDRLAGEAVAHIASLVRPEILGVLTTAAARHVQHALSESLFTLPGGQTQLRARWGRLPAGSTVDPAAIEPIDAPSWIIDLDMFCAESRTFDAGSLVAEARTYAERIYTFFRWATTDQFLERYGGSV